MRKNQANDEVDLLDVFQVIWDRKFVIFLIIFLSLISVSIFKSFTKVSSTITAATEIRPITAYEETEYKIYNLYMEKFISDFERITQTHKEIYKDAQGMQMQYRANKDLVINNINKKLLFELFIERLKQKNSLINGIKKSDLVKKEDYSNTDEYELAVFKIANSINVSSIETITDNKKDEKYIIEYKSNKKINWEEFLKFIENDINTNIQEEISLMLVDYLKYINKIIEFEIEDINSQLTLSLPEDEALHLKRKKNILMQDKYVQRIQDMFNRFPISKSDKFYAAKIIFDSTNYQIDTDKGFSKSSYILVSIIAAIFGIFFVLVVNAIQKRK